VRGTNWLGDAVMTTPALLRLRGKFPDSHIALLTPEKLKELWQHHPAVNEIISFSRGESVLTVAKKLRAGKFDTALILPNSPRSAMEAFLAGIPERIGHARPWRNFFLTRIVAPRAGAVKMHKRTVAEINALISLKPEAGMQRPEPPNTSHQSFEYLHVAAAMGANPEPLPPKLLVTSNEVAVIGKKFGLERGIGPIFGLNAGAAYGPAKRWPVEKFIAAAREIQKRTNCAWILFGGKDDAEITNQIQSAPGSGPAIHNLAGKTSLRELMTLLTFCRVFLTNDSGPMHVAAALGIPVVAIFGSTSPELTGPVSSGDLRHHILTSDAPCAPCFLRECPIDFRCMNGIAVDSVVRAVVEATKL
jgi:lipopolysaccharide heptosyltransferase II